MICEVLYGGGCTSLPICFFLFTFPFISGGHFAAAHSLAPAHRGRILSLPGADVVTLLIMPQKPVGLLCTSPLWNIVLWAIAILKRERIQVLTKGCHETHSAQTDAPAYVEPPILLHKRHPTAPEWSLVPVKPAATLFTCQPMHYLEVPLKITEWI